MSSLSTLDRDLCGILAEMRSDKITQRQKAFEKLELILVNREEDILRYMAEQKFDTNWHDLLEAAHHGAQKQNGKMVEPNASSGAESKSYIYIKVIQKVVDMAMNRTRPELKFSELIKRSIDVLEDTSMLQYFGVCYLQVLHKHVLSSKWDLTVVTYDEWTSILDRCFDLYEDGRVAKQNVVSCLSLAIRKSLENCSVQCYFVKFLDRLARMINGSDRGKMQNELLRIGYLCALSLAVDYRYEVCNFTEQISQRVVKAYEARMDEEMKSVLFKMMHLTVVVHSPEKSLSEWRSNQNLLYAVNKTEYFKCLRNFYFIIGSELKAHTSASYSSNGREVAFVEGFINLAARLCYVMFWNDDVWKQTEAEDEISVKRIKRSNKLQGLMDLVDENSTQPNWRWLIILTEIIKRCPEVLGEDDYQPLLNLLSVVQPKLSQHPQLEALRSCCSALLRFEKSDAFVKSTIINSEFCLEQWHKIIEGSFRCCTSNNKSASDHHLILQLLISNHKYPSIAFLSGILQAFYTYSIERTNTNVGTIQTILNVVPLEAIGNVQEVVEKLLNYLFPKTRETLAKGILHNKEMLDMRLLAKISVLCSVTKHHKGNDDDLTDEVEGSFHIPENKYEEVDETIRKIEEDILLKSAEKLLVVRSIQQKSSETLDTDVFYNIHEHNFEMLCTSLNFEKHTLPAENDALGKGLNNIIGDVELYLAILNDLLQHNALGRDSFEKCLITKKITFKVQEMEMGFDRLRTLTPVELGEMSSRLLTIFQGPYDERINEMLKASNFTSMLKWMFKNIRTAPERNSKTIEALKASDLNREQSNQHNLLLIVAHYMKYNGVNTDDVKVFLDQIDFNVDSSIDLFHIFGVCKVLLKQRSTFFCAEWILTYIKDICRTHHTNNAMTETIVDLFSDLVIFVSPHDSLFNDTNTVLLSFIRKANKRNYSVGLQRKIYDQVKYLIKAYPDYYESHEPIYVRMISLIESPHFAIKICALENLLYLFDDTWAFTIDTVTADFYRFQLKLYKSVAFEMDDLLRKDEKENLMSAHLQLICGTICKSYCLRKRATLNLVEQACLSNLTQHKVHTIAKLLKTAMSIDTAGLIEEYMEDILDMWISKGYKLASFPWYFTNCGSLDEFIKKYQFDVAYAIVSNRPADLAQYCGIIKRTQAEVMKAISTRCFAFLIPMLAGCDNMSEIYTQIANRMHPIITNHMDMRQLSFQNSSGLCVLQWIVAQLQDEALMTELFGREVLVVEDKCVLNRENFEKCLDHLKPLSAKQPLLTYLCSKYPATVEQLILHLKLKIFQSDVAEQKMILFFQYSAVIDHLVDYFCQHRTTDLKEFLARDICYFLSNTMVCSKSLQLPVLNCLSKFLLQIVPTCAEYVRPHLNILVSSLIAVYDQNPSGKVITKSLKILELIVVEHQALFGDAIKKLNYFPEHDDFKDLRETLEKLKESQFQLSLAEDIIRIVQLPQRKYGELITLYNLLASNKSELRDVCAELEASNGFSESCANNAVLRLINTLLNEIQSSCNEKHTVAALRCLGEIGPVDLCTMLLKSDVQTEIYTNLKNTESTVEQFVRVILLQLNDLLVTKDMSVVEKTTQVCYHLLQNRDYRKLAATLRTLYPYMALVENNAPIFVRPSDNTKLGSLCAIIDTATSYESFVLTLSTTLLESLQDMVIKGLTEVEINFAAKMIPMLVQIILSFKDAGLNYDIGNFVNNFFLKFADKLTPVGCMSKSTETIHLMLTIVECIRMNNQNHSKHTINLNWLQIAEASLHCQAYFKAILYGELWCMTQRDEGVESDVISRNPQLMSIMKTAHLSVGIVDAAKAFLDPIASRSEYYQLERRFHQSLLYYDVASSSKSTFERSAYVQTLKASSFYGLANTVANSESMDFECAWRLADWNIALDDRANQGKQNVDWQHVFEKQHYKALKCLELKDEIATESAVLEARKALAEMLKVGSMESTQNIYPYLSKLRQLQQIEDFMNVQFYRVIDGETELLQKWDQQDTLPYSDFSYMEANLTQRIAILKTARVRAMRKWVPDALNQTLFHLIHEARISGHFDVATANICAMSQQTLSETVKALLMLEDAQLNWANGDKFLSKRLVNEVVAGGKCKDIMVNAAAYRIYGTFLAETHAEDVHNLYKKFFKHSQTLVEEGLRHASQHDKGTAIDYQRKCLDSDRNFVILHTVAKYADREFVRVNNFFLKFADKLTPVGCMSKSTETIHLMLTIVECIRMNNQNHSKHTINLNWLQIAEASLHCQAYFKAILYGELWCMTQRDEGVESDVISRNPQLMSIMKTAHLSVGIVDAAKAFLDPIASRSEYYQLERRFHQSLLYYDVASSSKSTFERSAYVQTLKASGFYGLANTVANSKSMDFECAWRLADWNIALDDRANQGKQNVDWQHVFEKQHYKALKCLELKDEIATESAVLEARKALAEMLKVGSMESTQNIYPYLSKLRQLQQIEDFMNVQFYRVIDGETELLQKWDQQDTLPYSDFSYKEANLTQRIAILKTARVRAMRKWVPDALNQTLFHLIHEARISGHFDVATANICAMSQQTLSETVKALLMLEDAQLNWANGDKFLSKRLVNEVVAGGKCKDLMVNAAAYRIYGTFLAETHAEDVHNLYKKFFKHSQTLVEEGLRHASQHDKGTAIDYQRKCLDSDMNFVILHTVAKYADREFVRLKKHFTSSEFKSKKMNLEHMKAELIMLESEQAKLKESDREKMTNLRRAKISTKQNATRDEESINTMMSNMEDYLKLALFYYSAYTRKTSIESDLAVFRIVALWLGNHSEKIADTVKESLKVIPTFKFVPVLPQLAPRLDNHKEGVGRMVWETLERCAVDHPHHTLPHILAQVHAFADVERKDVPKDDERLLGAQSLYHKLLKNKKISAIVDQTTDMSLALIEMANKILGTAKGFSDYKMTAKDALRKCQGLDKVHCPTVELKVQESGDYNEIIGVHKWDDLIHGVGGINAPKKLVCHCSDGHNRIQLLKGRDDMRQDAVMQQVFCILNVLLRNDKEAGKQKLAVRTYKVVPLSKQSGILEWCSNTIPIGSWLIPAHSRYRPKDLTALDARKAFAELAKSSLRTKQEKFLKICQQLSPVFQHFFLERFLTSGMWFERRLAYTKSVAVSSIIGYILGIGDRHVQNILVDEKTAEVIHIDFGIAFELGKNLPTPETIPFRLTRDIVAGMGISGIEGVFKKSCEKTLEILRNNHAPIMTILEVLLYDPLYTWNVLANKKAARKQISELYGGEGGQDARSEVVNISAERALLRVSDKLNGKEDEKFTSVEGQVERLIFTASSNLNLCQLFQGWQPYL